MSNTNGARAIAILAAGILAACDPPCATAGFEANYYGSPAYSDATGNFAWPLQYGTPALTIHEFDPYMDQLCDVHVSFRVDVGPHCHLRAHGSGGASDNEGHFVWATATIDPRQACSLALDDGEATLNVEGGNMDLRNDAITFSLNGMATRASALGSSVFNYELSGTRGR